MGHSVFRRPLAQQKKPMVYRLYPALRSCAHVVCTLTIFWLRRTQYLFHGAAAAAITVVRVNHMSGDLNRRTCIQYTKSARMHLHLDRRELTSLSLDAIRLRVTHVQALQANTYIIKHWFHRSVSTSVETHGDISIYTAVLDA